MHPSASTSLLVVVSWRTFKGANVVVHWRSAPYRRRWRRLQRRATSNASSSAISAGARSDPNYMEIAAPPPNLNIKVP